ncbi:MULTISPECIES: YjfI family protein [unclassified Phenylobacterium]|uniref:YjfI family protein n=1 Tax=unclassified Phenylobacterium TaxID=2640670 RepID=UPI00083AB9FB|nr:MULTISPECIES: YjfI family protein [unclassified Phenylobacterium]
MRRPKDKAAGLSPAERTRLWREERQRLGLVKLELWVPPAAKSDVQAAARAIITASSRGPALMKNPDPPQGPFQMDHVIDTDWSVQSLAQALTETRLLRDGELTARVLEGTEPVLQITMHEFGDLPIFLSVGAEQIVVSALMWPVDEQKDQAAFNVFLLKAQKLVPLSNFGITTVAGRDYYEIFGELTCKTTLQTVIIELRMLAENAIRAADELRENFAAAA